MKVDISLMGDGFKVSKLKLYLDKVPRFKYEMKVYQEFGEPRTNGPHKGKPSKFGFCWINGITLKQLKRVGLIFRTYNVSKISINIKEKDLKSQSCLYLDRDLIHTASMINADIEIVNF